MLNTSLSMETGAYLPVSMKVLSQHSSVVMRVSTVQYDHLANISHGVGFWHLRALVLCILLSAHRS